MFLAFFINVLFSFFCINVKSQEILAPFDPIDVILNSKYVINYIDI